MRTEYKNLMILDSKWYWTRTINHLDICAWAVIVYDIIMKKFKAYIWVWTIWDEELDIEEIIDWWTKLNVYEALWIFGNIEYNEQRLIDEENFTM